jgi:hypothetical protein
MKLWADGNKWWSGTASSTTVRMYVPFISAHFNTTTDDWSEQCNNVGGPSDKTICTTAD